MSSFITAPASPFGTAPSPFITADPMPAFAAAHAACACRAVAGGGRDLVAVRERATATACDRTAAARAAGSDIPWEGGAATLFRRRLADCEADARLVVDAASHTMRLSRIGGA